MEKKLTAMMELCEWVDSEILSNPYYAESPRLKTGAEIVKIKATELLSKEKEDSKQEATGFAYWKERLFKESYACKSGKRFVLIHYEGDTVTRPDGTLYGEHYDMNDLYNIYTNNKNNNHERKQNPIRCSKDD